MSSTLENASHQSVLLAKDINWPKVWEAARDRGRIVQSFYRLLLTTPVFGDRICWKCDLVIPPHVSFIEHISNFLTGSVSLNSLVSDLTSESSILHSMKSVVYYH